MKTRNFYATRQSPRTDTERAVYRVSLDVEVTPAEEERLQACERGAMTVTSMGFRERRDKSA